MFKNIRKLTAVLLSAILILSTMATVFAEGTEAEGNQVTVNTITGEVESLSVKAGETAVFKATVEGKVRSYQWQVSKDGGKKWKKLNAKEDTLSIEAKPEYDGYLYRCAVTFKNYKVAYTNAAKLTVPKEAVAVSESVNLDQVSVDADYQSDAFSEPVSLGADLLEEEDARYTEAEAALADAGYDYENMLALDIHFLSQANGEEVEPDGEVNVSIQVNKDLLGEDVDESSIMISHITENGVEVISGTVSEEPVVEESGEEENSVRIGFKATSFSTFTITWRTGYNARRVTVHYVDGSGNELTISNPTNTYPDLTAQTSFSYSFLIYDIEGYEYDYTYRNTNNTNNRIAPLLNKNNSNYWRYTGVSNINWQELSNNDNIYVVYKKKTAATTGGTPEPAGDDEEWPEGEGAPQFGKSSTNNGDGTNTISLSIAAAENPVQKVTPADVIVVFDVSGSMGDSMNGQTRLARAKTAVNTMAQTLLSNNNEVRLALISFSTAAEVVQGFTSNYNTFSNKVNGLTANGGTNWELSLKLANQMDVRENAATFIVFVTDGDPTYRLSRGDLANQNLDCRTSDTYSRYRNVDGYGYNLFGTGTSDPNNANFTSAVKEVSAIKGANKSFYAIGISNDVTKVQTLTTQGGVAADHAFIASDSTAMTAAFQSITEAIKSALGFGDVEINDGITELTNSEMKVMETVDPNSFKYYRWGGENNKYGADEAHKTEWTTREADGCAAASYNEETGAVQWNMGSGFQLENGVHYVVEFRVWASQEAYDLVAELNNGTKTYADLTDEEKAQVVELAPPSGSNPGNYTLKTNTNEVSATYKKTTKTGETVTISDNQPITATYHEGKMENIQLDSMKLTIKKEFEDDLTAGEDRETEVTLLLLRRLAHQSPEAAFEPYAVPQQGGITSAEIVLNEANNWSYEIYVAPGVMANGEVLEHGYDFSIQEPDIDFHYSLIEEIINPMVVDGVDKFLGDGWLIDDQAEVADYVDERLTAVNRVKSGIDIKKVLVDPNGLEIKPDVEFTIRGRLLDADGNPFTFNNAEWTRPDESTATGASAEWVAHQNDPGAYHKYDKDGERIVYKGHFDSTANIEFTLKPGEYIRFINVPEGCTFEFYEEIPSGDAYEWYNWVSTTAVTQHRVSAGGEFTTEGDVQPVVDEDGKAHLDRNLELEEPLTGVVGNKQYSITFTNETEKGEWFYVYHSSDNTIEQIFTTDERVKKNTDSSGAVTSYSFNMVNETKTGYLYGGYFTIYKGAGLTDAEIAELPYTASGTSGGVYGATTTTNYWATDNGTNKRPYTGEQASAWSKAYTESGLNMTVVGGTVYYLKEVPEQYFRPALYYVYDDRAEGKPLLHLYLMLPADDGYYQNVGGDCEGMTLATSKKLYSTFKVTNYDGTEVPYTVVDANDRLPRGYLAVWSVDDLIVKDKTYKWTPFFVTKDNVKVTSITTRTISIGNGGHSLSEGDGGFTATDEAVTSTAKAAGN